MENAKDVSVLSHTQAHQLVLKLEQAGLGKELAQNIIESKGNHKAKKIIAFLTNNENPFLIPENPIKQWEMLYEHSFGMKVDFTSVKLPEEREGLNRLIIVAKGMKIQQVYDKLKELFACWKYIDSNLDEAVFKNDRVSDMDYAIYVRDRIESDEENKGKSANELEKEGHTGITLLERLLLELHHFWTTGEHLDIENWTLCGGSRRSDGVVPNVGWDSDDGGLEVGWSFPDGSDSGFRSRSVVSA